MQSTEKIKLDLNRKGLTVNIFAKQYDVCSRFLEIELQSSGLTYSVPNDATARLHLLKPDGHIVINDGEVKNGKVTVELTEQALAASGKASAEIRLYRDGSLLTSQSFYINIEKAEYSPKTVESSHEYKSFTDALDKMDTAVKNAAVIASEIAGEAAQTAEKAAEGANNVNIRAEQTETGADITVTDREGVETTVHIDTLTAVDSWADVRNAVRLGLAPKLFPVGYEFTTLDSDTGNTLVWAVRGHDHHTPANSRLTHSMTLEMKNIYSNVGGSIKSVQFDAQEALYYAEDGLAAGTYHFTVANQTLYEDDNGKSFQFTLTQSVPAGGQVAVSAIYNQTLEGKSVATYASPSSTDAIETTLLTEGSAGTDLGTTNGADNVNHFHRIILGSSNYAQSAIRQWFNSSADAGSVWSPQTKFDRPPSWATSLNGFMHGLPSEFLSVVETAVVPCITNSFFECASLDGTEFAVDQVYNLTDSFFVLSRPEIYGTWDSTVHKDGELLDYYDGLTNEERKKYSINGTAGNAWIRSSYTRNAGTARVVYGTTGGTSNYYAYNGNGAAPACIIA